MEAGGQSWGLILCLPTYPGWSFDQRRNITIDAAGCTAVATLLFVFSFYEYNHATDDHSHSVESNSRNVILGCQPPRRRRRCLGFWKIDACDYHSTFAVLGPLAYP